MPDWSIIESGLFGVGKGPGSRTDRAIQAENPMNVLFDKFPPIPIDTPERLATLWCPSSAAPAQAWKRDGSMFFSQFRITQILTSMMRRRGFFVTPALARKGAPVPDDPSGRTVPDRQESEGVPRAGSPESDEYQMGGKVW